MGERVQAERLMDPYDAVVVTQSTKGDLALALRYEAVRELAERRRAICGKEDISIRCPISGCDWSTTWSDDFFEHGASSTLSYAVMGLDIGAHLTEDHGFLLVQLVDDPESRLGWEFGPQFVSTLRVKDFGPGESAGYFVLHDEDVESGTPLCFLHRDVSPPALNVAEEWIAEQIHRCVCGCTGKPDHRHQEFARRIADYCDASDDVATATTHQRDRARDIAVQLEQENALLAGFLVRLRAACEPHAPLITIDELAARIDAVLLQVTP